MVDVAPSAVLEAPVADLLVDYLTDLSRTLHARLGDVAGVAVTLATDVDGLITVGSSTPLAAEIDAWQYQVGRGPCLAALSGSGGGYVPDLGSAGSWGEYGPGAAARGARSCLSLPVEVDGAVRGVIKVYSGEVDGLTPEQRLIGQHVATEVAGGVGLALSLRTTMAELRDRTDAMDARRTIDLALGMVMERVGCGPDEAFDWLRRLSQQRNVKVRDVAAGLVSSMAGPTDPVAQAPTRSATQPVQDDAGAGAPFWPRGSEPAR